MIRFADKTTRDQVREMWETVFGDSEEYMDLFFRHKYKDDNTLLYMEDGKVAASLQMLPYRFSFCGSEIPVLYLAGVSTLPAYRRRGYTRQLLQRSIEEAARRDVPLMLLIPQEEWLLGFYEKYGFAQTFDEGPETLPSLKELSAKYPGDLRAAFAKFSALYGREDMTVQKSFDDFRAIMENAALSGFPPAGNLMGMARVIDAGKLLSLFAGHYNQKTFSITVHDRLIKENNARFFITEGKVETAEGETPTTVGADIKELAQVLLGYHTSGKGKAIETLFPEKKPQMHYMLE